MKPRSFTAKLERDTDGTWWFVHVPKEIRESLKQFEKRGIIHITARVGQTSWDGSMLPWADGSAQISVNKRIRDKESMELGQELIIEIKIRAH